MYSSRPGLEFSPGIFGASGSKMAGLSQVFRPSEDEEMESAPQDMKEKWRNLLQSTSTAFTCDAMESKWQDIPMELLLRILTLVDVRTVLVASGVCTGWREAMGAGIVELSFSWCGKNVSKLVQSVAPKFSRLQSCNLRRCTLLNDEAVEAIARHCHDLRSLDLSNCSSKPRLTDLSVIALASGCKLLQTLDLSGCTGITEAGLVALAESCHNLRHLNLCSCENACLDKALTAIARYCSSLQVLNAGWCDKITDVGVTALAKCCPDLRGLDLCGCHLITDLSVVALAERCLRLRFLGLHCCRNLTDASMYALVNSQPLRIQPAKATTSSDYFLDTNRSTSSNSSNSGSSTPKGGYVHQSLLSDESQHGLLSLNLSGCTALSGRAVQAVCDAFPALHTCPERHSLNVSGCIGLISVHCRCVAQAQRSRAASRAAAARRSD